MRKYFSLTKNMIASLLLIVLLILSSCSQGAGGSGQEVQQPTDELVIYIPPNLMEYLPMAIRIFEREFPHVQVEARTFADERPAWVDNPRGWTDGFALNASDMEDFNLALRNALITNRGPDVVIWYDMIPNWTGMNVAQLPYSLLTFPDLFKTVAWTDLFLDLEPIFLADYQFNRENYVEGVLDVGLIGDRRLFVPLMYNLPILVTTKEALEYFGIKVDFEEEFSFCQLRGIIEEFAYENKGNLERSLFAPPDRGLGFIYPWLGEAIIDYCLVRVNVHSDTFRTAMYSYKLIYEMSTGVLPHQFGIWDINAWHRQVAPDISNRKVLFNFTMGYVTFGGTYTILGTGPEDRTLPPVWASQFLDETPVWFPIPSLDGTPVAQPVMYAAIRSGSSNQYNAYEFLRILMSEEWQLPVISCGDNGMGVYPVNKQALERAMDGMKLRNDNYDLNVTAWWLWSLPPQTEEEWLDVVHSAVADANFTHSSIRIVYEEMLPFFRGEQTFEEAVARLENKLTIYVGE
jgi:hypothetical protein